MGKIPPYNNIGTENSVGKLYLLDVQCQPRYVHVCKAEMIVLYVVLVERMGNK